MASWVNIPEDSDFSLYNLPYGVFSTSQSSPRVGVAIGDQVLDLKTLSQAGVFNDLGFNTDSLQQATLNEYASQGNAVHRKVRQRLQELLKHDTSLGNVLRDDAQLRGRSLVPIDQVTMHLPMNIGDYTDHFIGLPHAQTSAEFLSPGKTIEQLIPSFWDAPAAYHGRSSTVVVSGTPVHRPKGQTRVDGVTISGLCQKLDFEVEFAAFISTGNEFGTSIPVDEAEDHIFGFVLLNDWSARDFQKNEIASFTSKNFATSISPWIVPLDALEPFRTAPVNGDRKLPDYLVQKMKQSAYDIPVKATLKVDDQSYHIAECNTNNVVFSVAQMIAHHSRGGCALRPGDLLATGTISGPAKEKEGCLMELSYSGTKAYTMSSIEEPSKTIQRTYLEDGDEVIFTAQLDRKDGLGKVGFGSCAGKILPGN
ncbi:hypothetical protein B0A52_08317 [Exophiala mesophila]|uniref:Fumarylacetoacetase n=1 Tax=Exophiala mesophila TaxID=212818 RepID=A0A438MTS2_EXOME|nr:hypothetical protein B0A52_08317 [Exophiala mesophila]